MAQWQPKVVPDSDLLPHDIYTLKVVKVTEKTDPALSERVQFRVVEPAGFKGQSYFQGYFIGTDEDPMAEEHDTQQSSRGLRGWKKLLNACDVAPMGDTEEEGAAIADAEFHAEIIQYTKKKGDRAGESFNDIRNYYKLGSAEPGSMAEGEQE